MLSFPMTFQKTFIAAIIGNSVTKTYGANKLHEVIALILLFCSPIIKSSLASYALIFQGGTAKKLYHYAFELCSNFCLMHQ